MKKCLLIQICSIFFSIIIGLIILFFNINFSLVENNKLFIDKIYIIILYFINIIIILYKNKIKNRQFTIILAFNLAFGLFLISNIILDLLNINLFGKTFFFTQYEFNLDIKLKILYILEIALIGMNLGDFLFDVYSLKKKLNLKEINVKKSNCFEYFGTIIFFTSYIATLYKIIVTSKFSINNGYLALYASKGMLTFNPIINLLDTFTYIGLALILTFSNKYKKIYLVSSMYIATLLIELISGARAEVFTELLILLVFFSIKLKNKLKLKYIVVIMLILIFVGQGISYSRTNREVEGLNAVDKISDFFEEQGNSYTVLGYTIEHENSFSKEYKKICVFKPIINTIKYNILKFPINIGNNFETANEFSTLTYKLSYIVNENLYYKGYGIGNSFVAEVWLGYGLFGVFIACLILSTFIKWLDYNSEKKFLIMYLMIIIGPKILLMPRGGYFDFVPYLIRPILIYFLIYILYKIKFNKEVN
ncbi:TPA: O-antigen polysaccharide polymerase Wzy [Clostridium perfringens]